jgi:uncharacterized membrane protein
VPDFSNPWILVSYAAAGIALAATAGMRAFLPLLVIGIAARLGRYEISEGYRWLGSDAALIVFGIAVVAETLADKLPLVDHALDTVQTVIKPAVGTMAAAAMFVQLPPFEATVVGLLVGGTVATTVHLVKSKVRLASSLTTGTLLNPILSFVEDVVATVVAAVAILAPLLALVFIALLAGFVFHQVHKRFRPPPRAAAGPPGAV